jgi:hypothetical protein
MYSSPIAPFGNDPHAGATGTRIVGSGTGVNVQDIRLKNCHFVGLLAGINWGGNVAAPIRIGGCDFVPCTTALTGALSGTIYIANDGLAAGSTNYGFGFDTSNQNFIVNKNGGKFSLQNAGTLEFRISGAGKVNNYASVTTAGYGIPSVFAEGHGVAWAGSSTVLASYSPTANGSFLILGQVSAKTNSDTVTVILTYTDVNTGSSVIETLLSSVSISAGAVKSFVGFARATATSAVSIRMSSAGHTTTHGNAIISQAA